jgi:hypothetical protein
LGYEKGSPFVDEVPEKLTRFVVVGYGSKRYGKLEVLAGASRFICALAVAPPLRFEQRVIPVGDQGVLIPPGNEPDRASATTVTPIRSATRYEFLASKADDTPTTVPRFDFDPSLIDKHEIRVHERKDSPKGNDGRLSGWKSIDFAAMFAPCA